VAIVFLKAHQKRRFGVVYFGMDLDGIIMGSS